MFRLGVTAGRDAEFRDRNNLDDDETGDPDALALAEGTRRVTWADGLVRMASEAADALDPTFRRTGQRGERNVVVIHHDVDPHGTLGPGQLELGPVVPDPVARYLACDATVQVVTYRLGQIIGIHPTERTPNRATRRYLARRDQGCTHPLCSQRLWLHAHHIVHWEHGGPTCPPTWSCCARSTTGPSTTASSRSKATPKPAPSASSTTSATPSNPHGPTRHQAPGHPTVAHPRRSPEPYTPPLAERLTADTFTWN